MASVVLLIAVFVALGICLTPRKACCFEDDPEDSLQSEPSDSLAAEGEGDEEDGYEDDSYADDEDDYAEEPGAQGPRARRYEGTGPAAWLLNTHPQYNVSIQKRQDVTNWDTKISLQRRLSEKLSLNLTAKLHTRENSTLNRSDSDDGTTARLTYRLNPDINFGLKYNSSVSAYRFGSQEVDPSDRKKKEDLSVSSDFSKKIFEAIDLRVSLGAGSSENSFESVRNRGTTQDLSTSISFSPAATLDTEISYTGKRMLFDSEVDSGGVAVFTSQDRSFSQNISLTASYDVAPGIRLDFDAGHNDRERQHPDPERKQQETERRWGRRAAITSSFGLFKRLTWDVSVDFSESNVEFALNKARSSLTNKSSLSAGAKLMPWRDGTVNLGGSREVTRSEYTTAETGDDVHQSLSLKLTQGIGSKADLTFTALTDMVSVFYDDKATNPKDRDRLSNRLNLDVSYSPRDNITTKLGGEFSEEQSVYVKAASSANNRTTRKYRLSGTYDIKKFYDMGISQTYDIAAVYTYYHFGESENTLVRNSNVQTRFRVPITWGLALTLQHDYKFQDQGSYRKEGSMRLYGRSAEKESHVLNIGVNYTLRKVLKISAKQVYRLQDSWRYEGGKKLLDYETASTEISGKVAFRYDIGEKTKISLAVQQNRKEGSRVNKAFKSYRNVEFEASHVF